MDAYMLTSELKARVNAMTYAEGRVFWDTEYPEYVKTLPVADLLTLANSTQDIRNMAQTLLMCKMEEAGLKKGADGYIVPCCGQLFQWRLTAVALSHIKHSPCPNGFTITDGKWVCDCKRKYDTPELVQAHLKNFGNCLHERKRLQTIYCVVCEHQSQTKKQHEEHLASKAHDKKVNPVKLTCECCEVVCRTKKEFDRHCAGKQHIYKANPMSLTCACCKITCLSRRQMETHEQTNKHKKNMETLTNGDRPSQTASCESEGGH